MSRKKELNRKNRKNYMATMDLDNDFDDDEINIDFSEVFAFIRSRVIVLAMIVAIFVGGAGIYTKLFMAPQYGSSGTIFLTPQTTESGTADYTSLNVNSKLVKNVMGLLTQDNIMLKVAENTGMDSAKAVRETLTISNQDETEIITIKAVTSDPKLSKKIVSSTIKVFIETMQDNLNVKNIEVVNPPKLNYEPVGPSLKKNVLLGMIAGIGLDILYIAIAILTDNSIKNRNQAEKFLGLPVLCEVPDMVAPKKEG
ncbi:MAG: Wzz/FepE/Etk N-terminal domain-containing protein [Bacillota bacterium]|nr:Wzz/FepE/Etk N-terminal domain-containing protein [Bacillota bacterium]